MQQSDCGAKIADLFLGAAAHADDVRTVAHSSQMAQDQANNIVNFTKSKGLKINAKKCELISISGTPQPFQVSISVDGVEIQSVTDAKSLGDGSVIFLLN